MELTLNFAEMRRFALLAALMAVGYLLVRAWNDDFSQRLPPAPASTSAPAPVVAAPVAGPSPAVDVPVVAGAKSEVPVLAGPATPSSTSGSSVLVEVVTDTLHVWIDANGDVIKATLPRYPLGLERKDLPTVLLDSDSRHIYVAESGLIGANGPDARPTGRPAYRAAATHYALEPGRNELFVPLAFVDEAGVRYTKTYRFQRGRYELQLEMKVDNASASNWQGNMFVQLKRDGTTPEGGESGSALGPKPFLGIALTTAQSPYQKVDFEDVKAGQIDQPVTGGWIAILQHYFLVSWIAQPGTKNQYFGREGRDGTYLVGFTGSMLTVPAQHQASANASLYIGPKVQSRLAAAAPNLELTVDYGVLWVIASPLFKMLNGLHGWFNNWGAAIIGLTVLVKLVLYPLSAYSYRSMARMRDVTPEMKRIQERYAGDREKLSKEMMDLYRREKVNPLGGCLPMLVQMPVFLSLYWVLYESVELRQAPFIAWIVDLSIKDPYFVLPLLMGGVMYVQQFLNPPMPDPMQARMMKMMPVIFTVMFAFFPAGLVLYWLVNNFLSFLQQWWVTRQVTRARARA